MTIRAYLSHACPPEAFSLAENRKRIQLERKNVERVLFRPGLNRFKQLEAAQNRKGADTYRLIEEQYRQAQKELEAKINTWYQRFATNNGVSMAEARRMLRDRELTELKWDVKEYIKRGQENAFTGQWVKELENASARFHISRLEALKLQTQQSLELMFGNQLDSIDAAMKRIYLDGYYHTAYELQKGFRIGWDIAGLD